MAKRADSGPPTISTGGNNGSPKVTGKVKPESGRSHKENQERAFIAASRRSDRSLEARVQSARAASNIHRERTGKGFKITEEIVLAEEMYEEEEDDLPRPYRALAAAAIASSSPLLDNRVSAYVTNRIAMADAQAELYAEVDRKFAEHFGPVISPRHTAQPIYYTPCYPYMPNHLPQASQQHAPLQSPPLAIQCNRAHSVAQIPPYATAPSGFHNQGQATRHASFDERLPTPALSPRSTRTLTPSSSATPQYYPEDLRAEPLSMADADLMIDPSLSTPLPQSSQSSFTSELPNDVKTILGLEMADPLASVLMGDGGELIGSELIGTNYACPAQPLFQGYSLGRVDPRDMPLPSYESPVEVSSCSDLLKSPPLENPAGTFLAQDNHLDTSNNLPDDWNDWINDPYDDTNQPAGGHTEDHLPPGAP